MEQEQNPAAAAKNQLDLLNTMRESLFSQSGWGCQHVSQEPNWDVPDCSAPPLRKPNIINGTFLWEANLRNGRQPPLPPVQKTLWAPTSNLGGTWGHNCVAPVGCSNGGAIETGCGIHIGDVSDGVGGSKKENDCENNVPGANVEGEACNLGGNCNAGGGCEMRNSNPIAMRSGEGVDLGNLHAQYPSATPMPFQPVSVKFTATV